MARGRKPKLQPKEGDPKKSMKRLTKDHDKNTGPRYIFDHEKDTGKEDFEALLDKAINKDKKA